MYFEVLVLSGCYAFYYTKFSKIWCTEEVVRWVTKMVWPEVHVKIRPNLESRLFQTNTNDEKTFI